MDMRGFGWGVALMGPVARLFTAQGWYAPQRVKARYTNASATGSLTLDFASYQDFILTATGNITLANPTITDDMVGQRGCIQITQDGTGSRTLTRGTMFDTAGAAALTLSTGAGDIDLIYYHIISTTVIFLSAALDVS
jgi:hypothetical protein